MLPRVSVVILNYNGLEDTLKCLDSVFKCDYPDFEVIVLDNGSTGSVNGVKADLGGVSRDVKVLRAYKHENYRFIDNGRNLGFAGGCNAGMKMVLEEGKSKYIYLLNNDAEVDKDFLRKAVEAAEEGEKQADAEDEAGAGKRIGIVASKSLYFDKRDVIENAGHLMLNSGDAYSRGRGEPAGKFTEKEDLLSACGAAILLKCDMLREIGLFDEDFFLIYEDVDLTFRAVVTGWRCVFVPESIIYHKVSATIVKHRDYKMTLRGQVNQFKAYYYNTPLPVLVLNSPFVLLRFLMMVIGGLLFLQWRMVRIFLHAYLILLKNLPTLLKKRRFVMKHRKLSSWYIFKKQRNFIPYSFKYFWDIVVARKRKSIFEV